MTITSDNWKIREGAAGIDPGVAEIAEKLGILLPTARLLSQRGCADAESARRFISKSTEMLHDPFLMKDMEKAARRILAAVENGERIVIYGDYDVDGVTSVSCLWLYLNSLGAAVDYYIPERSGEGYGMSSERVRKMAEEGTKVIVTVDTGITAVGEADSAKEVGIDLVVTDHHECHSVLPDAYAIVNPRQRDCPYPFKELAGVGVVFKLLTALEILRTGDREIDCVRRVCDEYIDLVAIGTVADVMPVVDENRLIVAKGLDVLDKRPRLAIRELMKAISADIRKSQKKKMTSNFIGFTVAPRINAAGRIASASIAVEFFISEDVAKVSRLALELCEINKRRQNEENHIVDEARRKIAEEYGDGERHVILLSDEHWHHGVIGIVSSRITERYGVPSILVSFEGSSGKELPDDLGKGSGRSVRGINLVNALHACSDLLVKFGGHELAAGLSVRRSELPAFRQRLEEYVSEHIGDAESGATLEADMELLPDEITCRQAEELSLLEPYGVGNATPVFVVRDVEIANAVSVGEGKHARLTVSLGFDDVTAMCFRTTLEELDVYPGDRVDIAFNLDLNDYQNQQSAQLIVKELSPSLGARTERKAQLKAYRDALEAVKQGSAAPVALDRAKTGEIYNMIRSELRLGHEVFSVNALCHLAKARRIEAKYAEMRLTLDVFAELGLLGAVAPSDDCSPYRFHLDRPDERTELSRSAIFSALGND